MVWGARERAQKSVAFGKDRCLVNIYGEVLHDDEGNVLSLDDMSKSWYSENGGRNNAKSIVKRLKKAQDHPADIKRHRPKFITLTFRTIRESWAAERAIQQFTDTLRKYCQRHGGYEVAYYWTAEVQQRGALHYHLLILGAPYISKNRLQSWWAFGFVDVRIVDDTGRAFKYLAKYLWKWGKLAGDPESLPDWWFYFSVFSKRRYGFSRWFSLSPIERIPRWLYDFLDRHEACDYLQKATREPGGGWTFIVAAPERTVKMWLPSPYRVRMICI